MTAQQPPRVAARLVSAMADEADRCTLLDELEEGFERRAEARGRAAAVRWYWMQVAILAAGLSGRRLRDALAPGAVRLDFARALRSLRRSPALTLAGALTLGIGIAAPTGTFAVIDAMFAHLPVEDAGRVTAVQLFDRSDGERVPVRAEVFDAWTTSSGFSSIGAYDTDRVAVSGEGLAPRRADLAAVTDGVFHALAVQPVVGRTVESADLRPGADPVVLIGERLWADWFDRDPGALGTVLRVDDGAFTLVGVMPSDFGFPTAHEVWIPLTRGEEPGGNVQVVGRLADGWSPGTASEELAARLAALPAAAAGSDGGSRDRPERLEVRIDEFVLAFHGRRVRTLMAGLNLLIGFLVLIAAANLSAFFLARGTVRGPETAVRLALGGGRLAVVRPLVFEALIVSVGGMAFGVTLATGVTSWMATTLEARGALPYWADFGLSPRVLGFASVLMLGATVVAGLWPALRGSRLDVPDTLKSGRGSGGPSGARTLSTLVGVEVLLACVLLVLSGIVVRSALSTVQRVGAFPYEDVVTAEIVLEEHTYPEASDRRRFFDELERRLHGHPAAEQVSLASALPGDGTSDVGAAPADRPPGEGEAWPSVQRRVVTADFFEMFGMTVREGRTFGPSRPPGVRVAVVNEQYVTEQLGGASPVGMRLLLRERGGEPMEHEVVGVLHDPGVSVDDGQRVAALYLPVDQVEPRTVRVAVRRRGDPGAARAAMQEVVQGLDPTLPLDRVMTLEAVIRRENDGGRILGTVFGAIGLGALLLAVVGLYGVVAFTAARRSWDVAVMRALGAPERRVLAQTVSRGLRPVLIGLLAGLACSWGITPVLHREMLEGASNAPSPHDPVLFGGVALTLLAGALVAVLIPAVRSSIVNPAGVMRAE